MMGFFLKLAMHNWLNSITGWDFDGRKEQFPVFSRMFMRKDTKSRNILYGDVQSLASTGLAVKL